MVQALWLPKYKYYIMSQMPLKEQLSCEVKCLKVSKWKDYKGSFNCICLDYSFPKQLAFLGQSSIPINQFHLKPSDLKLPEILHRCFIPSIQKIIAMFDSSSEIHLITVKFSFLFFLLMPHALNISWTYVLWSYKQQFIHYTTILFKKTVHNVHA